MERSRGTTQEIPNSMSYNNPMVPQISSTTQESSPVKLPLAPILSTPPERRANPTVSTRRGSAIFSPTQTLDHRNPPPPLPSEPTPDPDPAPFPTSNSKNPASPPQPQAPPLSQQQTASITAAAASVKYRECLKNHAANIGGHVVDGCGEFMPGGEEGTLEALRCAACDCHRNFHRREVEGETQQSHYYNYNPNNNSTHRSTTPLLHGQAPPSMPPQLKHAHSFSQQGFTAGGSAPPTMVNFGGNSGGAAAESSSEDLNMFQSSAGGGHAVTQPSFSGGGSAKKRFRTKFSQEQKQRMHDFAARLGWRIQKQDEQEVQQFCNEVGVKRQVFKVFMHNNKQAMKKRQMD